MNCTVTYSLCLSPELLCFSIITLHSYGTAGICLYHRYPSHTPNLVILYILIAFSKTHAKSSLGLARNPLPQKGKAAALRSANYILMVTVGKTSISVWPTAPKAYRCSLNICKIKMHSHGRIQVEFKFTPV